VPQKTIQPTKAAQLVCNTLMTFCLGVSASAVLLFVGSAAYTLTVLRDEVSDFVYNDDTLGDWSVLGFGFGKHQHWHGQCQLCMVHQQCIANHCVACCIC
jgi:hypothetical protein